MTEKIKGKSHPFADHLRASEEVLWLSVPAQPSAKYQALSMLVTLVLIIGALGFGLASGKNVTPDERLKVMLIAGAAIVAFMVFFLLMQGIYKFFTRNRPVERAYAITNERLLYRNKKDVSTIPLENLPSVSLFLGSGTKGTFSFGAFFPMWPDVEDAIQIKHLIDDAQSTRMKKIAK